MVMIVPAALRAPVLLMAGWFDPFLPGQLADFLRIRREAARPCLRTPRGWSSAPGVMPKPSSFPATCALGTTGSRASRRAFPGSIATCGSHELGPRAIARARSDLCDGRERVA